MWGQDRFGNFRQINGAQEIKLNYESNCVRFTLQRSDIYKSEGALYAYVCAYVIGDFNNWQKTEDYKLHLSVDHNNGRLKMTEICFFNPGLKPGIYEYSYVLVDIDGNETLLSSDGHKFKAFSFEWLVINHNLEIKTSENFATPGFHLDLIVIKKLASNRNAIVPVEWSCDLPPNKFTLKDSRLWIDPSLLNISEITVSAKNGNNTVLATRTLPIVTTSIPRNGKLIHFIRSDNQYKGDKFLWDIWTYAQGKDSRAVQFSANSDFGATALIENNNLIVRKQIWDSGWHNDWAEQTNSFAIDDEYDNYYLIHGDNDIYTSLEDVITRTNPRITYAVMDEKDRIAVYLSHEPLVDTRFDLYINSIKQENICTIVKDEKKQVIFTNLPPSILPYDLLEIRANNTFLPCKVTMRGYLDNFSYPGNDMGVVFIGSRISLRVWAPSAKKVEVLTYSDYAAEPKFPEACFHMAPDSLSGTHHTEIIRNEFVNKYFLYRLYFDSIDRNGRPYTKVTYAVDPYAYGIGLNGDKGVLVDLNSPELMPEGWIDESRPPLVRKEDVILYELHLRDFTISPDSGINPELRGKFTGVSTSGGRYTDSATKTTVSTGVDSLVELGITHVHILPFFDFSSVDETKLNDPNNRNWGYDPKNYNAPDGSYSVDPYDPLLRIKETRQMVHQFHQHGIRVVMDMVYNHMSDTKNLDNLVPGYYFRSDYLGRFTNGSGCGNEIASERPMVRKMIIDSVIHWIKDFQIDGLRFDLMELIDIDTIRKIESEALAIDPSIIIYGEPWSGGSTPLTNGTYRGSQKNHEFAIFNDTFRDALRGNNNPGRGFINGEQHTPINARQVLDGLRGSVNRLTVKPRETINYIDAHDNYTLWDHLEKSQTPDLENGFYRIGLPEDLFESSLVRQNLFGLGLILTAQGIPFFQGGAEILRTKNGDHNSYKSDDTVNAFHWKDKVRFKPIFDYIKGLITLRKSHPAFRMADSGTIYNSMDVGMAHNNEKSGVIISHFKNFANGDSWRDIVVIYNATTIDNYEINNLLAQPEGGIWHIVVNHEKAGIETIVSVAHGQLPALRSHSMMVIHS